MISTCQDRNDWQLLARRAVPSILGIFAVMANFGTISFSQQLNPTLASPDTNELSLEQLINIQVESVFGASKYEQKITEAPASISIVSSDEIKKFGYRTLAEALDSVRGLYLTYDRNYTYFGLRGFLRPGDYNIRELFLIDGHRMNDNLYDAMGIGRDAILDVDSIERIEVIRGPSSSIYGSSGFFGVINIITKRGAQINGLEASVEAGSFDSYKGRLTFGKVFRNDIELHLSGSIYDSAGDESLYYPEFDQRISADPRARHNGFALNSDSERAYNLFGSISYHDFTFSGAFVDRYKKVPTASFDTVFDDRREETTDIRGYLDLKYEHEFPRDLRVTARLAYDFYPYWGTYPYQYSLPSPEITLNKDYSLGQWITGEFQLNKKIFDQHMLIFGTEYRENFDQTLQNFDEGKPDFYYLDSKRSTRSLGVYGQAEIHIITNLTFNGGLRYDHYFESFGGTVNPRLALIYSPWQGSAFKALYGEAFRAPNDYERSYFHEQHTVPELNPEKIRTYELAYEQHFAQHYRFDLSGYYYTIDDLINQTTLPSGDIVFRNLDKSSAKGLEAELKTRYDCGLFARASYTLQRSEDDNTHQELSNSPRHLAKLNLSLPLYRDKVFASFDLEYKSSARTLLGRRASDYVVGNFTIFAHELVKNLELSGTIYNLWDARYGHPGAEDHLQDVIQQDGRSFRIKLTYKF